MITPETSTLLTLALYALATGCGVLGTALRIPFWRKTGCWLALAAFVAQTVLLATGFHKSLSGGLSLGAYLQMLAWFVTLCGLAVWLKMRQEAAAIFAAPLALLLFAMSAPYLGALVRVPDSLKAPFYTLHIGALFLSLGLLALAFAASTLFLFLEGRIKSKQRMEGFWQDMPALSILDRVNAITVLAGFPLYTIGLAAGLIWARPVYGAAISGDPKEVITIVIWILFAWLFHNRLTNAWKGRKPARLVVFIFMLSLFSIIVVNTFMDTHHAFIRS
ncbi:MAG: cytochrome c biogenesis protein CcsA [Desulfovibrionaceae bacterium]|nr:cytochrome c biogenesis protein CcsA [Desulfovibrionaceae bacterium]